MTARVVVLDYGSGNLRSAERALARTGAEVVVSTDATLAREADGLVVPGVGAYAACMAGLAPYVETVRQRVADGRPTLGICVGMQVLFERGVEHGVDTPGLHVLPGVVQRLDAPVVPHMGWNTVSVPTGSAMFAGVEEERFYFVHSYAVLPLPVHGAMLTTTSTHGTTFVAGVEDGALWATQFHPEKSGDAGATLLASWVATLS